MQLYQKSKSYCGWGLTRFLQTLITLSIILTGSTSVYAEPQNLGLLKRELITYHDSGRYQQELQDTINKAHHYLLQQALANQQHKIHHKLALILDIDETSLSNYNNLVSHDFSSDRKQIRQYIRAATAPAIQPMLSLYNDAIAHGIKVFFVSGRGEVERDATQKNLSKAGYSHWSGLYLRPNDYQQPSIVPFKSKARANITAQGYTVIASIGDQYSDIKGGHAKKGFKLPNPFYYLP
ncbi:MAG: HAD family acid phosphatase [Legionellales bacterium]